MTHEAGDGKAGNLEIRVADITTLAVDAIVNAANTSLLGGGGVDGAIHRAAGPRLLEACRALDGCATGDAKLTPGFDLPARFVIHAVGPVWHGGDAGEDEALAGCYRRALGLAAGEDCASIAFPAISCGVYRFPPERAAAIAVRECRQWLAGQRPPRHIILCCFDEQTRAHFARAAGQ